MLSLTSCICYNSFSLWKAIPFRVGYYIKYMPILDHSGTNYHSSKIAHCLSSPSLLCPTSGVPLFPDMSPCKRKRSCTEMQVSQTRLAVTCCAADRVREELETHGRSHQGHLLSWSCPCALQAWMLSSKFKEPKPLGSRTVLFRWSLCFHSLTFPLIYHQKFLAHHQSGAVRLSSTAYLLSPHVYF